MSAARPAIVLVPGAWHRPEHYRLLTTGLEAHGYTVHGVSLPSCTEAPTNLDFTPDVAATRSVIEKLADQGNDILVLMHSAGGIIGSEACKSLSKSDRSKAGIPGGVIALFYMCAFVIPEGQSLAMGGPLAPWVSVAPDGLATLPKDADVDDIFYNDTPPHFVEEQKAMIKPFAKGVFYSEVSYVAWKWIPSTYLLCERDAAVPTVWQEGLVRQEGARFEVVRVDAGHLPWLSRTGEVVEAVRRTAGDVV